jgi:hypothetical protein
MYPGLIGRQMKFSGLGVLVVDADDAGRGLGSGATPTRGDLFIAEGPAKAALKPDVIFPRTDAEEAESDLPLRVGGTKLPLDGVSLCAGEPAVSAAFSSAATSSDDDESLMLSSAVRARRIRRSSSSSMSESDMSSFSKSRHVSLMYVRGEVLLSAFVDEVCSPSYGE